MIKDKDFLNAASLAYIHWDYVPKNESIENIIFDLKKKNTRNLSVATRHLYMVASKDTRNETPMWNFSDWYYLYSGNRKKLFKDMFKLRDVDDNGFYAVAFENETDIIIAFRGTDDAKDILQDVSIGAFERWSTAFNDAYNFCKYIRALRPDKTINVTGHSLGGCLAQTVAMFCKNTPSFKDMKCVTFNALGVSPVLLEVDSPFGRSVTTVEALKQIATDSGLVNPTLIASRLVGSSFTFASDKSMFESLMEEDHTQKICNIIDSVSHQYAKDGFSEMWSKNSNFFSNLKIVFGFNSSEKKEFCDSHNFIEMFYDDLTKTIAVIDLRTALEMLNGIQNNFLRDMDCTSIRNFVFSKDWTTKIQPRLGTVIELDTGKVFTEYKNTVYPSGVRKLKLMIDSVKLNIKYHTIGNFIIYLNEDGELNSTTNFFEGDTNVVSKPSFLKEL